ncbi:MAG: methyl-accepting chemotaxis protein [Bacteroidota bacterium]
MNRLNGAHVIAIITFLLPPSLVATIAFLAGIFSFEKLLALMTSWPMVTFLFPFVIGVPLVVDRLLIKSRELIRKEQFHKLKSTRTQIILLYQICSFGSAFAAIPICYYNGFTTLETIYGTSIAVCYVFSASVPLSVKFLQETDKQFKGIPIKYIPIIPVKLKTFAVNISIAVGGGALILVSLYCLLWRFENFPELGFTTDLIFFRLLAIVSIVVVFQVIPNILMSYSNIRDIGEIKRFVDQFSGKDLSAAIALYSRDEFGEISERLNVLRENFSEVLQVLKQNTANIHQTSVELNALSGTLSATSSGQAANAEEIAASVEQTSANIASSTEKAEESVSVSDSTFESINSGHQLIVGTEKNVNKISEKVEIIQQLADQTNLLAINAFIEAANAGNEGKGFAVVAREIRALADRSKVSAEEISDLADQCAEFSAASVEKSNEMMQYISRTAEMSHEVNNSSKEQLASIEQINYTVQDFNRSSQTLSSSSEELSATSEALVDTAKDLESILSRFKLSAN